MGVLGEMFPGRKITDEAGEDGQGEPFRLGPIDLDNNVVVVHRGEDTEPAVDTAVRAVDFEPDRPFRTGPSGPPQG